jgi:alpha-L-fucosidase
MATISRRGFMAAAAASPGMGMMGGGTAEQRGERGKQRLSQSLLEQWEQLKYGMFIHFGMSTFVQNELPDGKTPPTTYAPDRLDVGQWISVARDAGMKYAILTTKHVAGHCLWPSKYSDYTVANSTDKTDVVGKFVEECRAKGILPGFYYCSWDNHNRFGSKTPSDSQEERQGIEPFTTSVYQTFQTNQITELLTTYGPIFEMWVDIPGVLGRGYRTFLYNRIAELNPAIYIMMNSGISTQEKYDVNYAFPSDLIAIERSLPPGGGGHNKWREIESREYYMPGEVCDPIGKDWFYTKDDRPRPDDALANIYMSTVKGGANLLLDVGPDIHGLIPDYSVQALMRLRKNVGI